MSEICTQRQSTTSFTRVSSVLMFRYTTLKPGFWSPSFLTCLFTIYYFLFFGLFLTHLPFPLLLLTHRLLFFPPSRSIGVDGYTCQSFSS
ncbi:hypothetical protein BDV24DRAFT_75999 [Aspergillus arachidicola]|uniref:Uncharacterized protein n=1 Tax=Aspergillus arachidicola TaxID=656916 RepID=A0A5N6Y1F2_9EURO|nr:hypothetical protein BDV24DRAFT_75999 [Aspergillus arachidicola]